MLIMFVEISQNIETFYGLIFLENTSKFVVGGKIEDGDQKSKFPSTTYLGSYNSLTNITQFCIRKKKNIQKKKLSLF